MMHILSLLMTAVCVALPTAASAQSPDGTILSREPAVLPGDAPETAHAALDGVVLERMIYASDGLEPSTWGRIKAMYRN